MLLFSRPSTGEVERFLAQARQSAYSYSEVGATSGSIPSRYTTDHNRVLLGRGPAVWNKAVAALQAWEMFNVDWIRLYWPSAPIQAGENVAVLAQYLNCYWLNACRIVYVIEDDGPVERFGFAYGTLCDHAESGDQDERTSAIEPPARRVLRPAVAAVGLGRGHSNPSASTASAAKAASRGGHGCASMTPNGSITPSCADVRRPGFSGG